MNSHLCGTYKWHEQDCSILILGVTAAGLNGLKQGVPHVLSAAL